MKNYAQIDDKDYFIYRFPLVSGKKSGHKFLSQGSKFLSPRSKYLSQEHKLEKQTFSSRLLNTFFMRFVIRFIYKCKSLILPFLPAGRKLRKYAESQLEKLHPCYSQQDVFTLRRSADGETVEAAVINRRKLAEYRAHYRFRRLYIAERLSFPSKFVWLLSVVPAIVFFLLLVISIVFFAVQKPVKKINNSAISVTESIENNEIDENDEFTESTDIQVDLSSYSVVSKLNLFIDKLSTLTTDKKSVQQLTFVGSVGADNHVYDKLEMKCIGFLPEEVTLAFNSVQENLPNKASDFALSIPLVQYDKSGNTSFNVYIWASSTFQLPFASQVTGLGEKSYSLIPKVREIITLNNGKLTVEEPDKMRFQFTILRINFQTFCSDLKKLSEESEKNGYFIKTVELSPDNKQFQIKLEFSDIESYSGFSSCLENIAHLFLVEDINSSQNTSSKNVQKENSKNSQNYIGLQKTGEIHNKDGSITSFYKSQDGKIIISKGEN